MTFGFLNFPVCTIFQIRYDNIIYNFVVSIYWLFSKQNILTIKINIFYEFFKNFQLLCKDFEFIFVIDLINCKMISLNFINDISLN